MNDQITDPQRHDRLEPIYDYDKPFAENYEAPVEAADPFPTSLTIEDGYRLLGRCVAYPLGVPASPLTASASRISHLASQGLSVFTYKTVRSEERPAFPEPNWFFVKGHTEPLSPGAHLDDIVVETTGTTPPASTPYSMVNSFGMPSPAPDKWMKDVQIALSGLRADQLLLVSVVGSFECFKGDELVEDFVRVALMAEAAGAHAVELNLSCPNTLASDGKQIGPPICSNASASCSSSPRCSSGPP